MRALLVIVAALAAWTAQAAEWVEIGADPEAKYYVDVASIEVEADTVRVLKKGIYTHTLTENLGGNPTVFKQTIGTVELDCKRRINRVVQIDMIDENDEVVWSSGRLQRRLWEDVRPNTHGEVTLDFVCGKLGKS
ncbi:MAG TPA: surface-adhesin E family protein [Burkholderiales bacterium]|nr:surface-adhesin E family protein [Burkholderiales bacterium]